VSEKWSLASMPRLDLLSGNLDPARLDLTTGIRGFPLGLNTHLVFNIFL
jgi:hypothetical protein